MIQNKKDLQFYVAADRMMNGLPEKKSIKEFVRNFIDRPVGGGNNQLLTCFAALCLL